MTPRKQKHFRQPPSPEPLRMTNAHAAGIDIHAAIHWVAVRHPTRPGLSLAGVRLGVTPHCFAQLRWYWTKEQNVEKLLFSRLLFSDTSLSLRRRRTGVH